MADNSSPRKFNNLPAWGMGIAIGVAIGAGIGSSMGNVGFGIAIGVAIGLAFGIAFQGVSFDNGPSNKKD